MRQLNVSEARRLLSRLVDDVVTTREPVVVARRGRALVRIVPCDDESQVVREGAIPACLLSCGTS